MVARCDRLPRTMKSAGQAQPTGEDSFPFRGAVERLSYLVAVIGKRPAKSERQCLLSRQWQAIAPRERMWWSRTFEDDKRYGPLHRTVACFLEAIGEGGQPLIGCEVIVLVWL